MKILWLSQHEPLPIQIEWLKKRFGDVEIRRDVNPFANAEEIKRRFQAGGYDEIVVVAPLWVILRLTELSIKPLWAEMQEVQSREGSHLFYHGRYYRFLCFRRIVGVEIKFEEV